MKSDNQVGSSNLVVIFLVIGFYALDLFFIQSVFQVDMSIHPPLCFSGIFEIQTYG